MNETLSTDVSQVKGATTSSSAWLNMEQDHIPEQAKSASEADVLNMLGLASQGESAVKYVTLDCAYVKVTATNIEVALDFYVWPYDLQMIYTLTADLGDISSGSRTSQHRSLDAVLNGTKSYQLPFLFEGHATKEMPFFYANGVPDNTVTAELKVSKLIATKSGYCVFRLNGIAKGYLHTIVMKLPKTDKVAITDLKNTIIAEWLDGDNVRTTTLNLKIPDCVEAALRLCDDNQLAYEKMNCGSKYGCNDKAPRLGIYYNACDGKSILDEHWVENT